MSQEESAEVVVEKIKTAPEGGVPQDGEEGAEGEKSEGSESVEIVLKDRESRPIKGQTKWMSARINQVKEGRLKEKERADREQARADKLQQENDVFKAGEKMAQKPKAPNPDDFDDGTMDPDYIKAMSSYDDVRLDSRINERFQKENISKEKDRSAAENLRNQEKHYERAEKLKMSNYLDVEETAKARLGNDVVEVIINRLDTSEILLGYLGAKNNESQAEHYSKIIKENPGNAIFELGKLSEQLIVKPSTKDAPNPDEPLDGSTPPRNRKRGPKGATYE